jgi:hypothetical protein
VVVLDMDQHQVVQKLKALHHMEQHMETLVVALRPILKNLAEVVVLVLLDKMGKVTPVVDMVEQESRSQFITITIGQAEVVVLDGKQVQVLVV